MKLCQSIILLIIVVSVLATIKTPKASAENSTFNRVISKWSVGAPWEPIEFGVNVSDSPVDVLNVTLFYSINFTFYATIPTNFSEVTMQQAEGDLRNGFWTYTLPGQPNSTSVYYTYAVYYTNGDKEGPTPPLDQPYLWRVYSPERVFTLIYLGITSVDPTTLTVDLDCSFDITWDTSPDSLYVQVGSNMSGYVADVQYVAVPLVSGNRYWYSGSARIDNLHLIGDPSSFPFDSYFLRPEFKLYGADRSETTYQYVPCPESLTNVWSFSQDKPASATNDTIDVTLGFERRPQNALIATIPLLICCSLLGASLLLSSHKHLTTRLTIYIALVFFLFGFVSNIRAVVPTIAVGTTFAEMVFLCMPGFVGIYLILSIIGKWSSDLVKDSGKALTTMILDLVAVLVVVFLSAYWVVVQNAHTSKTLIDMMSNWLLKLVFWFALSFGLIFNGCKEAITFVRTHKKQILLSSKRRKQPANAHTTKESEKDQKEQNLNSERREPFRGIFEIALVLLTVISATETTLFAKTWNDPTALKFAIYPFLIMIFLWLTKELYKNRKPLLKMNLLFSEICWEVWSLSLSYYLFFLYLALVPPIPILDVILASMTGLGIFTLIQIAYYLEYKDRFRDYYKDQKWIAFRTVMAMIFTFVVYLVFLPVH